MKNTSFEVPIVPPAMRELLNQWESDDYAVIRNFVVSHEGEEYAIKRLLEGIEEDYPEYEPLETATAVNGIRIFVAAKCKLREDTYESK